jgi:hypothetical protein
MCQTYQLKANKIHKWILGRQYRYNHICIKICLICCKSFSFLSRIKMMEKRETNKEKERDRKKESNIENEWREIEVTVLRERYLLTKMIIVL